MVLMCWVGRARQNQISTPYPFNIMIYIVLLCDSSCLFAQCCCVGPSSETWGCLEFEATCRRQSMDRYMVVLEYLDS